MDQKSGEGQYKLSHLQGQRVIEEFLRCKDCCFWQSLKNGFPSPENNPRKLMGDNIGECRRSEPRIVERRTFWPVTYEFDWCSHSEPHKGAGGLAMGKR